MALPLARVSPLIYPNRRPGIDRSHPAANGMMPNYGFSGVCTGVGNIPSLLSGIKPGIAGGTFSMDGYIGPSVKFATTGLFINSPAQGTTAPAAATFAAIVRPTTGNATSTIISPAGNGGTKNLTFDISNANTGTGSSLLRIASGGTNLVTSTAAALPIVTGTPFFVAASINSSKAFFVAVNLQTGQIYTETKTGITFAPTLSTLLGIGYGGNVSSGSPFLGNMAAVMWSPAALSPSDLRAWAADPWAFWYPRTAMGPGDFLSPEIGAVSATTVNASVAQTLGGLVQTATAGVVDSAAAAQTLGALVQALTGTVIDSVTVSQALGNLGQTTTAAVIDTATTTQTLGGIGQTSTGAATDKINASQTLGALGQSAALATGPVITVAQTLGALSQVATGGVQASAVAAQLLGALGQVATSTAPEAALANQILGALVQSATATLSRAAFVNQVLGALGQTATVSPVPLPSPPPNPRIGMRRVSGLTPGLRRVAAPQMNRVYNYPTTVIPAHQLNIYKESVPDVYEDSDTYSTGP